MVTGLFDVLPPNTDNEVPLAPPELRDLQWI